MIEVKGRNEALLVKQIDELLREYVIDVRGRAYASHTPPSTEQNFASLNSYCGDIIASLDDLSALVLEVKINSGGQLKAFQQEQHAGLLVLEGCHLPIFYSYNIKAISDATEERLRIGSIAAVKPSLQKDNKATGNHTDLQQVVDGLLSGSDRDSVARSLAYFVTARNRCERDLRIAVTCSKDRCSRICSWPSAKHLGHWIYRCFLHK